LSTRVYGFRNLWLWCHHTAGYSKNVWREIREYLEMQKLDADVERDPKNQRFANKEVHSIQDFPQELGYEK
jgi:hypothetical protein